MTLLDPRVWIAALLIAVAGFGLGYVKGNTNGKAKVQAQWDAAKLEQQHAVAQAKERDTKSAHSASVDYQKERASNAEQTRIVRQTVVRTVTGPCLDDRGLRITNQAIGGVPAASAAR